MSGYKPGMLLKTRLGLALANLKPDGVIGAGDIIDGWKLKSKWCEPLSLCFLCVISALAHGERHMGVVSFAGTGQKVMAPSCGSCWRW